MPAFSEPEAALGEDLFEHLPQGEPGRRWRALLNDVQIVLHNHPHNAVRMARGQAPVNALWVWGAGRFPTAVRGGFARVFTADDTLDALARAAGAACAPLPGEGAGIVAAADSGNALIDLTHMRDLAALQRDWLQPALAALRQRAAVAVELDARDGACCLLQAGQRFRFWRRPWAPPR